MRGGEKMKDVIFEKAAAERLQYARSKRVFGEEHETTKRHLERFEVLYEIIKQQGYYTAFGVYLTNYAVAHYDELKKGDMQ